MRVCMFVCDVCVTCVDTCRGMFAKWVGVRGQFLQSALPQGPHSDHQAYILRYQAANIFTYDWATSLPAHVFLFIRILNFLPIVCTISSCTKKLSILSVYPRILFNHNRMAGTSLKQTDNARQGHRSHPERQEWHGIQSNRSGKLVATGNQLGNWHLVSVLKE